MVALLTSDPIFTFPAPTPSAQPDRDGLPNARRSRPRHLHAVPTPGAVSPGTDAGSSSVVSVGELAALAVVLVVALFVVASFRTAQAPPAGWTTDPEPAAAVTAATAQEMVVVVEPGDTLWGIAGVLAPGSDRREVVQKLAERNGGSAIWAGQTLVVPASVANL